MQGHVGNKMADRKEAWTACAGPTARQGVTGGVSVGGGRNTNPNPNLIHGKSFQKLNFYKNTPEIITVTDIQFLKICHFQNYFKNVQNFSKINFTQKCS